MKKNLAKKITLGLLTGAVLMSCMTASAAVTTAPPGSNWENSEKNELYFPIEQTSDKKVVFGSGITTDKSFVGGYYTAEEIDFQLKADMALGNSVIINGGKYGSNSIYGGYYFGRNAIVNNNSVEINNGTFITVNEENDSETTSLMRQLVVVGGGGQGNILGGSGNEDSALTGGDPGTIDSEVKNNSINIYGGSFDSDIHIFRGGELVSTHDNVTVSGNRVVITGGKFVGNVLAICGGFGNGYRANVSGNSVTISGGDFDINGVINIIGGTANSTDASRASAVNNTVTISGDVDMAKANLYGGQIVKVINPVTAEMNAAYGGASAPNVLNIGTADTSFGGNAFTSVQGFDAINFEHVKWDTTMPTVKVNSLELEPTEGQGTTITVKRLYVSGDDTTFAPNNAMTLIDSSYTSGVLSADSKVETFYGVATIYDTEVVQDGDDIKIELSGDAQENTNPDKDKEYPSSNGGSLNEQVLVIGESRTAATAFVNQGSELIETGLDALHRDKSEDETKVFAALYNGASKYETGSHIKVNGWSGIVGVGKTNDDGLTYGAFFESGEGNYRTYNNIDGMLMRGDGEANYNGGGLLIRKDHKKGFYAEASLRAGNLSNRLDGAVMGSDGLTGYDIDSFYYGAHIGIGKIIPKGADSLDIYGKFLYTHHDDETFEIDGDEFRFDSMDSQRLRLGLRYNSEQTDTLNLYYGAAWEYEFSGDAEYSAATFDLNAPSLEGSTVIGELGMHYLVTPRWSLDANVRGYAGQRDGWSGSVQANYSF